MNPFINLPDDLSYVLTATASGYSLKCHTQDDSFSVTFSGIDCVVMIAEAEDFFNDETGNDAVAHGEVASASGGTNFAPNCS